MPQADASLIVVEDNPTDAALIGRVLRRNGLADEAEFLSDGQALLNRLGVDDGKSGSGDRKRPRLVVLDLKLPKVSGLEALKSIDEDERLRNLPVVVLTSSSDPGDIRNAYASGANSYVVKPVDATQFNKKVTEMISYWLQTNLVA